MARGPRITWERLADWIGAGYGQGFGEHYQPFIRLHRWNPSPVSFQHIGLIAPYRRQRHFFSHSEYLLAVLFSWLGAQVREQFPAWPFPHAHPNFGLDPGQDSRLPWSQGLLDICREAGVAPGVYPGTDVLYIWTLDLVLTLPPPFSGTAACVLVSVKPIEAEEYVVIDPLSRGVEKLEVERRYAVSLGSRYFIGDRTRYPGDLLGQLDWLKGAAFPPTNDHTRALLCAFLDQQGHALQDDAPSEWVRRLQMDFNATKQEADYLVQHCIWHQHIDCDLSYPLDMERLPRPGGRNLRAALLNGLTGGAS